MFQRFPQPLRFGSGSHVALNGGPLGVSSPRAQSSQKSRVVGECAHPSIPTPLDPIKASAQPGPDPLVDDLVERLKQTEKEQA
jgi:hypothetical protein